MKYRYILPLTILVIVTGFWISPKIKDPQIDVSQSMVHKSASGGIRRIECAKGGMHKGCTHDPFFSMDPVTLAHNEAATKRRLFTEIPVNPNGVNLIESVQADSDWKGQTGGAIRARQVRVSRKFLDENPFQKGEILKLNLFDDVVLDTVVYESFANVNETISTTTRVANTMFGRAVMAFTDNELRVKVILPESNKIYEIQYNHTDGNHYVLEMDPAVVDVDGCGVVEGSPFLNPPKVAGEVPVQSEPPAPPMVAGDEGVALVVIDNLVVYPENVVAAAGSEANVKNIAAQGIALANEAHNTTNTGMYINLIHSARLTGYTDTGDQSMDLDRVTELADGVIDDVHTLRDTYGADFVHMMHSVGGGLGWMPNFASTGPGQPQYGFSVTGWDSFASYTPGHELGHNMNLSHSKFQETNTGTPADPTGADSAGWHWHPSGNTAVAGHCSVMSYTNYTGEAGHTRVGLFSDPNIVHNGQPAGHVTHANAARVLRLYKNIYATYRTRPLASNSILVESPNGGEVLSRGQTAQIRWNSDGVTGDVKLELYRNGVFEREITAGTINDRIFYYTIPNDLTSSNLYKVRISSVNNPAIADVSDVDFTITQSIYSTNLDTNPGFTSSGGSGSDLWQYGAPSGDNSTYGGPGAAYTGTNIYDTNLTGVSFSTNYLTTPAINCSSFQGVVLKFAGQFSVGADYRAVVEVSNNGTSWTQVSSVTNIFVSGWTEYTHDISAVANGQSTVYVRWVHFRDGAGSNYSGMSVDDVSITGVMSVTQPLIAASVNALAPTALAGNSPANQSFSVRNDGIGTLNYSISDNQSWVSVSPSSGSSTGEQDTITVSYSTAALAPGNYSANITISDNAAGNSPVVIPVSLSVTAPPIYFANMDADPGWTLQGAWAWGAPTATDGDPSAGFTGTNVVGYNLAGAYTNSMVETHATTTAINCSDYSNVQLSFYRWLGVESGDYDKVYVRVSADGTNWTNVFAHINSTHVTVQDTAWAKYTYDISAIADGQSTVFIRWTMGTTDTGIVYSGWNLDDVKVEGSSTPAGTYTVTFDANGGGTPSPATKSVTSGATYGTLATVSRPGYTFNGWFTAASGGTQVQASTTVAITANQTLYAQWSVEATQIYFANMDSNPGWTLDGDWAWGAPTATDGDPSAGFTGSNVVGYNLNGAYTDSMAETHATTTAINCSDYSNVQLSFYRWLGVERGDYDQVYVRVSADGTNWTNVFAHATGTDATVQDTAWAKYTYDISAIADGQSTVFIRWTMGTTDTGIVYSGWNLDDVKVEGTSTPASTYTVTFDANGGGTPSPATKSVTSGATYGTLATISRTGYTFNGWFTAASGGTQVQASTTVAITADQTLYAQWTAVTYTVSYNGNGNTGGAAPSNQSKTYGVNLTLSNQGALVRSGYSFAGWNTAVNGTGTPYAAGATYTGNAALTLYARWTPNSYTVTFNANGGTGSIPLTKLVTYGSAYGALATTSRAGYTFNGWFTASSGGSLVTTSTTVATASVHTLYARWTANSYTVTFHLNYGTTPILTTKPVTYGLTYGTLPTPTLRTGYTFAGWFTAATGGTLVSTSTTVSTASSHTLYARWTGKIYTVTFNVNGGAALNMPSKSVTYGSTYGTLATVSRTNYCFNGWFTAVTGGTKVQASTMVAITTNQTLYARWGSTCTVFYNGNGHTGGAVPTNQIKSYNVNLKLALQGSLVRTGYTFAGWNTAANGSGTPYAAGAMYSGNATLTLYARWTATVTFNANGGTAPIPATKVVTLGSTYGTLATTSRMGYIFTGWFTAASGGTLVTTTTKVATGHHTLYARWTANTLANALDTTGLTWSSSGNAPWFNQTSVSLSGGDAAQSGAISDNGTSSLSTTIVGPGTLTFWWKVSSESGYDFLKFYYDGVVQTGNLAAISGEVGWVQRSVSIPAGTHTVEWRYTKDGDSLVGADKAWVDQVAYTQAAISADTSDTNGGEAPSPAPEPAPVSVTTDTYYTVDKDGRKYLTIVIQKSGTELLPLVVEVSGNLTEWFSGSYHTTVISDEAGVLKVRDNTPVTAGVNRYIRLKP